MKKATKPMRYFTLMMLLVLPLCALAQLNDSTRHYIKFAATGLLNTTNTGSSYVLSNQAAYSSLQKTTALNLSGGWVYGANQNTQTNNDLAIHADLNFFKPGNKLYYWTLFNFDKSYSLKVNYRWQAGAGISFNLIDSPDLRINLSDGILYERGDIKEGTIEHKTYSVPRNSARLLFRWTVKDRFTINGIHFYQPSLSNFSDYIILSTTSLSVKVYKLLNLSVNAVYNKVNNTQRETLLMTFGLSLEKYF